MIKQPILPLPIQQLEISPEKIVVQSTCHINELFADDHNDITQFKMFMAGTFIQTENHEHQYSCNHRIHMNLCNPLDLCPRCTNNQLVLEKENEANQKVEHILRRVNNSCSFYWKSPQEHKILDLWRKVKLERNNVDSQRDIHWMCLRFTMEGDLILDLKFF